MSKMINTGQVLKGTGTMMKLFANLRGGDAAEETGSAIKRAKLAEAASLRSKAQAERATGSAIAGEEGRKAAKVLSDFDATAAASGTGGPQIETLQERIASEGEYRKKVAIFGAEETAKGLEDVANMKAFEGEQHEMAGGTRRTALRTAAAATLLEFFEDTSLFDKFGEDEDNGDDENKLELT